MAAITTVSSPRGRFPLIRQAATTSQTDWILVPAWVKSILVYLSVTTAGTSTQVKLHSADPVLLDDAQALELFAGASITAASNHVYHLGPHLTNNGTDSATADTDVVVNRSLPSLLGVEVARNGSTYTLSVEFKG